VSVVESWSQDLGRVFIHTKIAPCSNTESPEKIATNKEKVRAYDTHA
jgi:hypothetical protein